MSRRTLVLTEERAGHWLRRLLPPHVFTQPVEIDAVEDELRARWRSHLADARQFLGTYCACFIAVTVYFA